LKKETIFLEIAGRNYPTIVGSDQEKNELKKAVVFIADKLKAYSSGYKVKDKQDLIAMCLLDMAKQIISLQETTNTVDLNSLKNLDAKLSHYLLQLS
jgi:hypothetical protein